MVNRMYPAKKAYKKKGKRYSTQLSKKYYAKGKNYKLNGHLFIKRHIPTLFITNTSTALVPQRAGLALAIVNIGTVVPHPVFSSTIGDVPFSIIFPLNALQDYTDIVNICDKYKIMMTKLVFRNSYNAVVGSTGSGNNSNMLPYLQLIEDNNDLDVDVPSITSKTGLKDYSFGDGSKAITYYCRPKPAPNVYIDGSAITSGYSVPGKAIAISTKYPTVEHYGLKGIIKNMDLAAFDSVTACISIDIEYSVVGMDLQ